MDPKAIEAAKRLNERFGPSVDDGSNKLQEVADSVAAARALLGAEARLKAIESCADNHPGSEDAGCYVCLKHAAVL